MCTLQLYVKQTASLHSLERTSVYRSNMGTYYQQEVS